MWDKTSLLLLLSVEAAVASQCWQGATFSEMVVSPAMESSGILRVPGVTSLPQCVAACCDLPGYDLAWLFEGRCYVLSCLQRANCRPRKRPGADSSLVFLRRAPPQTLLLPSLVRGEPYAGRWRPLSRSSEAPGDLEALKDLALFDQPLDYSEGDQEERGGVSDVGGRVSNGGDGSKAEDSPNQPHPEERDGFNQSEGDDGPVRKSTESSSSVGSSSQGGWSQTTEKTMETQRSIDPVSPSPQKPTTDSTKHDHIGASLPTPAPPPRPTATSRAPPTQPVRPLTVALGGPVDVTPSMVTVQLETSAHTEQTAAKEVQSEVRAPPMTCAPAQAVTSDPTSTSLIGYAPSNSISVSAAPDPEAVSEVTRSNSAPVAVVGPDRKLFLPVSSVLLDGSGSTDDHAVVSYQWEAVSAPPGLKLEGADRAVATATGLQAGSYTFRLNVTDQEGATGGALLTVRVLEARSLPPVAHASGSHILTLPNNSLILRGSVTDGDQSKVTYLWVRDHQSPAAGDVLYGSEKQASLYLANLVEGTYLFQLRVTDAQGRSSTATATVEVQPEPSGGEELELEMLVSVSQISVAQRDTVVRQLAAMLHVLDNDIQVRALQGHSHLSTVLRFSVGGPEGPLSGSRLVAVLRAQLLREKMDYLLFRVLRVDTVLCLLGCSGRGQCDPITKQCACDPLWTENLIRRYLGDGESNCEWKILYVILTSFILIVFILSVSWIFICCCKRKRQTKVRKKTKYTILDDMDDQERVELRPKFSIKHRSTEHNSSLMMSESELDSDQDTIFSRDRPVRSRNRLAARNGDAFG